MKKGRPPRNINEVLLIDEKEEKIGIIPIGKAFEMAEIAGLDLVVVAEKANPKVCKIMDHGKWLYEQKRKQREQKREQKKHHHAQKLKEIKFHVNVDDHDYGYKIDHAKEFLQKGQRVKLSVVLRGREMGLKSQGFELINKAVETLDELGHSENKPAFAGRTISVLINPTK